MCSSLPSPTLPRILADPEHEPPADVPRHEPVVRPLRAIEPHNAADPRPEPVGAQEPGHCVHLPVRARVAPEHGEALDNRQAEGEVRGAVGHVAWEKKRGGGSWNRQREVGSSTELAWSNIARVSWTTIVCTWVRSNTSQESVGQQCTVHRSDRCLSCGRVSRKRSVPLTRTDEHDAAAGCQGSQR
jgi:hypothetical protein